MKPTNISYRGPVNQRHLPEPERNAMAELIDRLNFGNHAETLKWYDALPNRDKRVIQDMVRRSFNFVAQCQMLGIVNIADYAPQQEHP